MYRKLDIFHKACDFLHILDSFCFFVSCIVATKALCCGYALFCGLQLFHVINWHFVFFFFHLNSFLQRHFLNLLPVVFVVLLDKSFLQWFIRSTFCPTSLLHSSLCFIFWNSQEAACRRSLDTNSSVVSGSFVFTSMFWLKFLNARRATRKFWFDFLYSSNFSIWRSATSYPRLINPNHQILVYLFLQCGAIFRLFGLVGLLFSFVWISFRIVDGIGTSLRLCLDCSSSSSRWLGSPYLFRCWLTPSFVRFFLYSKWTSFCISVYMYHGREVINPIPATMK